MRMNLNKQMAAFSLMTFATALTAQVVPVHPFSRTMDLVVCDSSFDGVWRLVDWNQDGDLLDADEVIAYYDESVASISLGTPTCLTTGQDGTVYIGDSNVDIILRMRDANGDGDANDAGEHSVFFDNTNADGLIMASIGGITIDAQDRVFASIANSGSTGSDVIFILEDLNNDGDANDAGEARSYHDVPGSTGSTGASIPVDVLVGFDTNLYYVDIGATGAITKGVYQLADINFDGDCNDAGERSLFWEPTSVNNQFYFGFAVDSAGAFYLSDHGSDEKVLRGFDANGNGTIEASEQTIFYQTTASTWWDIIVRSDGSILLLEDQTPDRITMLRDLNNDGDALDPGESTQIYDDTIAANGSVRPRGGAMLRAPLLHANPASVSIGTTTNFIATTSKPTELAAVFLSSTTAPPVSLSPWGSLEIAVPVFGLGFGISDANGQLSFPFAVPNVAAAVGSIAAQAWCGDAFRVYLSNAFTLTITP